MIKSVEKAILLLQILADADGKTLKPEAISRISGINKSTCMHLLETLSQQNMVEHVSRSEGYRIGYGTFLLTRFGRYQHHIISASSRILKWLTAKTGQTSLISVFQGKKRVVIDYVMGEMELKTLRQNILVESTYGSSTGLALAANLPLLQQEEFIQSLVQDKDLDFTEKDILSYQKLLSLVKRQGYATSCNLQDGIPYRGIAVPLFQGDACVAALGLAYLGDENLHHLKYVKAAGKEISQRLDILA